MKSKHIESQVSGLGRGIGVGLRDGRVKLGLLPVIKGPPCLVA